MSHVIHSSNRQMALQSTVRANRKTGTQHNMIIRFRCTYLDVNLRTEHFFAYFIFLDSSTSDANQNDFWQFYDGIINLFILPKILRNLLFIRMRLVVLFPTDLGSYST